MERSNTGRGRPRKYASNAEKVRAFRNRKKDQGYTDVHMMVPNNYKVMLDKMCQDNGMTQAEAICYLLGCYFEDELEYNK